MTYTQSEELRRQLQAAGRYMLDNALAWGNAGNLSAQLDGDTLLVTASGTHLGDLAPDDLVAVPLNSSLPLPPGRKPSKEMPMHRAVYSTRPEIQAVLHASPFYSTLVACSGIALPGNLFVEDMYYLERIARVPYCHPGSPELGEAVRAHAAEANVLLLDNHGVLVYDTSVREALMALHTLEFVSRMVITARGAGVELSALPRAQVEDFLARSGYRPRRDWPQPGEETAT
jgi:ribulose-5-phosphate 4-epimerase/fuculose-1-phosphate aldolase